MLIIRQKLKKVWFFGWAIVVAQFLSVAPDSFAGEGIDTQENESSHDESFDLFSRLPQSLQKEIYIQLEHRDQMQVLSSSKENHSLMHEIWNSQGYRDKLPGIFMDISKENSNSPEWQIVSIEKGLQTFFSKVVLGAGSESYDFDKLIRENEQMLSRSNLRRIAHQKKFSSHERLAGFMISLRLWKSVWQMIKSQVQDEVNKQTGGQHSDPHSDQIWTAIAGPLAIKLKDQIWERLWDQVWDKAVGQIGDEVVKQVAAQFKDRGMASVWFQLWAKDREHIWTRAEGELEDEIEALDKVKIEAYMDMEDQDRLRVDSTIYNCWSSTGVRLQANLQFASQLEGLVKEKIRGPLSKQVVKGLDGDVLLKILNRTASKIDPLVRDHIRNYLQQVNFETEDGKLVDRLQPLVKDLIIASQFAMRLTRYSDEMLTFQSSFAKLLELKFSQGQCEAILNGLMLPEAQNYIEDQQLELCKENLPSHL